MRAAILLATRPIYHLFILIDTILIVKTLLFCCCITCIIHGPNKRTLSYLGSAPVLATHESRGITLDSLEPVLKEHYHQVA